MPELAHQAAALLERIRGDQPLVHVITNFVTMNRVADAVRAVGARPVMAFAAEEAAEVAASARAVVLNLGTPTPERIQAMRSAARAANERGIPVVFDPVGIGTSRWRVQSGLAPLEEARVAVIRGNAGEMAALTGAQGTVSGVDSVPGEYDLRALAQAVAGTWRTTAAVTGPVNTVSDETRIIAVSNAHPYLASLTGGGDIASALIGACLAVEPESLIGAAAGLVFLGLAAEHAAVRARGLGSFGVALLDELCALDASAVESGASLEWII